MTSKVSFSNKMVLGELRRKAWVIALCALNFIFYGPILTLIEYTSSKQYMVPRVLMLQMEKHFICEIQNIFSVGFASVLLGITSFSFLLSKKRTDLYHSLPVSRKKLFSVMYVTGIVIFAATYLFAEIIRIIVSAANGFYTFNAFSYHVSTMVMDVIFFFMSYNLTVIAVMLTGNIVVCACGAFTLSFIYPLAVECFEWLGSIYFTTKTSFGKPESYFWSRFPYLSPAYTYVRYIRVIRGKSYDYNGFQMMGFNIETILVSCVVAAAFFAAALYLYKKRPSEAAGKALAFKVSQPVIRIPLVVISTFLFACGLESVTNVERSAGIWIALIVGGVLMHCVLEIIFNFDFKALFHHPIQMAACIGVGAVIVACYWFDVFHYDEYMPERDRIEEAAVFISGIDNDMLYSWIDGVDEDGLCNIGQVGGYTRMYENRFKDGPMIDAIYELTRISVAHVYDNYDTTDTVIGGTPTRAYNTYRYQRADGPATGVFLEGYDTTVATGSVSPGTFYVDDSVKDPERITIHVAWKLKNGKKVSRGYVVRSDIVKEYINDVYKRPEYKKAAYDLYDANDYGVIKLINVYDKAGKVVLGLEKKADIDAFMAAYISDMNKADIDTVSGPPIADLKPFVGVHDDSVYGGLDGYYIYPGFTNTLAFMENMDADTSEMTTAVDPQRVESIVVNSYGYILQDVPDDENAGGINNSYVYIREQYLSSDEHGRQMIELLCQSIQNEDEGRSNYVYNDFERELIFDVYYQVEGGIQRSFTARIRREDIPQELIDDLLYTAMYGDDAEDVPVTPIQPRTAG